MRPRRLWLRRRDAELACALEGSAALREQLAHAQAANAQAEAAEVLCFPSSCNTGPNFHNAQCPWCCF